MKRPDTPVRYLGLSHDSSLRVEHVTQTVAYFQLRALRKKSSYILYVSRVSPCTPPHEEATGSSPGPSILEVKMFTVGAVLSSRCHQNKAI